MPRLDFVKMSGAGNDFIVADNRKGALKKDLAGAAKRLCDRQRGVGGDGLILLENSKTADFKMRILNSDGSEAEMCGNGVRCLAKFAFDRKIAGRKMTVQTLAGEIGAEIKGNLVKAKMLEPSAMRLNFKIPVSGSRATLNFVNTGVPHAVMLVESVKPLDVVSTGRAIRTHAHFAPKGTNANFIAVRSKNAIDIRTYERGVEDETQACGTGSTAGALVAAALKGLKSPVDVHTRGGDVLKIYFTKDQAGFRDVYLEGRVQRNFEGRVEL
jgi:diaminopimelate epimerase